MATLLFVWLVFHGSMCTDTGVAAAATAANPARREAGTLWVLAVGVSRYSQSELNLRFADVDARAVSSALQHQTGGPLYRDTRTLLLTNEEVTRESILDSMVRFLGQAGPNDVAVVFLAGHGVRDVSSGSYYFLPASASTENYITAGVRMTDFDESLRAVRRNARAVVLMFDTCHAGALRFAAPHLAPLEDPAARLSASEGFFLLAASKPGEESEERPEIGHGAFSYAVLEGLAGAADADGDQAISVTELFGYVTREVAALTGGMQHPYYKIEGSDFLFAAVKSGVVMLTPRSSPMLRTPTQQLEVATPVPNTVAVLDFRNLRADPSHDWVGVALRTAFNTELSKVPALNVYAPELIDRAVKIHGTDQLAAAKELGIDRLVTGSYSVIGEAVRMDAHIVYTGTGLQEGSDSVQGELGDFFALQKRLVISVLRRMHVSFPSEAGDSTDRGNADVNAYRLLLESEGEVVESVRPTPATPARRKAPRSRERRSWLQEGWQHLALLLVSPAYAADTADTEVAVRQLLEEYRQALEAKNLDRLEKIYVDFPGGRREALRQYLEGTHNLSVQIGDVVISPHGGDIIVSYTRTDKFVDRQSGRPVQLEVRLTRAVSLTPGGWKIAGKP